jgi:hypothetical protein
MTDAPGNVVAFPGLTTLDIPAEKVLAAAQGLSEVVIVGIDAEGEEAFFSSYGDPAKVLWLIERFKRMLLDKPARHV